MKKHERLIIKITNEAEYYPSLGSTAPLKKNGKRVKTIVTNDDSISIANKHIKVTVFQDGRIKMEPHQLTGKENL